MIFSMCSIEIQSKNRKAMRTHGVV